MKSFLFVKHGWRLVVAVSIGLWVTVSTVTAQQATPWSAPQDLTESSSVETGTFSVLLCDRYQNLHALWAHLLPQGALLMYQDDRDGELSTALDVIARPNGVMIRISAAIAEVDDIMHVIWQDRYIGADVYYSQVPSSLGGNPRAWASPVRLASGVDSAQIAIDDAGVIRLLYGQSDNNGLVNNLFLITSLDGGASWSDPQMVYATVSDLPSTIVGGIAVDDAGRIHVGVTVRTQEYGIRSEVGYLQSVDDGQTWSPYRQISLNGTSFQGVSTMMPYAFGEDEIHLTWHDPRRMHQWSFDGGATWSDPVEIMPLGAAFGGPNHLVKDSAGDLHVILATGGGVFSATWNGNSWDRVLPVDSRPIDPHGQNMVVCQGNELHATYYDRTGEEKTWYSTRMVSAPHWERQVQPVAALTKETPRPRPTPEDTTQPSSIPNEGLAVAVTYTAPPDGQPLHPLVTSMLITGGLVLIVVIASIRRRKA